MTDTPEQIAGKLTKAQRDWLLSPQDRLSTFNPLVAFGLEELGLVTPRYCPTAKEFGHDASATGLQVRAILRGEA